MKPDREEYSVDEVALRKAGIDPYTCSGSVDEACRLKLPGCEKAMAYITELCEQIKHDVLQPTTMPYFPGDIITPGIDSFNIYISKNDAVSWQPATLPIKPIIEGIEPPCLINDSLSAKSRSSLMNLIKALTSLVAMYETKRYRPNTYPHLNIVKDSGEINSEALKRLLIDVHSGTPARADKLIREADQFDLSSNAEKLLESASDLIEESLKKGDESD